MLREYVVRPEATVSLLASRELLTTLSIQAHSGTMQAVNYLSGHTAMTLNYTQKLTSHMVANCYTSLIAPPATLPQTLRSPAHKKTLKRQPLKSGFQYENITTNILLDGSHAHHNF